MKKNEKRTNIEQNVPAIIDEAAVQNPALASGETVETTSTDTAVDPMSMQAEELEKARVRIAELEKQLRQEPQSIEERIAYYKRKQELTERYEHYKAQIMHLDTLRAQVEDDNELADDFSDTRDFYRLQLLMPGYSKDPAISITNQTLIDAVLDMLKGRMQNKAEELKVEISA